MSLVAVHGCEPLHPADHFYLAPAVLFTYLWASALPRRTVDSWDRLGTPAVALLLNKLGNLQDMPESFVIHDASLLISESRSNVECVSSLLRNTQWSRRGSHHWHEGHL